MQNLAELIHRRETEAVKIAAARVRVTNLGLPHPTPEDRKMADLIVKAGLTLTAKETR